MNPDWRFFNDLVGSIVLVDTEFLVHLTQEAQFLAHGKDRENRRMGQDRASFGRRDLYSLRIIDCLQGGFPGFVSSRPRKVDSQFNLTAQGFLSHQYP